MLQAFGAQLVLTDPAKGAHTLARYPPCAAGTPRPMTIYPWPDRPRKADVHSRKAGYVQPLISRFPPRCHHWLYCFVSAGMKGAAAKAAEIATGMSKLACLQPRLPCLPESVRRRHEGRGGQG